MTMLDDKGADYVARWPKNIALRAGLSAEYVIQALNEITGSDVRPGAAYNHAPIDEIGALDGPTAKAIVTRVAEISDEIRSRRSTHCHYCGLPLTAGHRQTCV